MWYLAQALLALVLPGRTGFGAPTPARLPYRLDGLNAWLVTHVLLYLAAFRWELISPTLVYDDSGGLLVAANTAGLLISLFAFWKARTRPTHPGARTLSGSAVYDFLVGSELNPRVGGFDPSSSTSGTWA